MSFLANLFDFFRGLKNKSNISKAIDELKKDEIYKLELQQLNKVMEKYPEIEALKDQVLSEINGILVCEDG